MSEPVRFDARRLEQTLPVGLSEEHKNLLLQVAAKGIAAANAGNGQLAANAAEVFKTVYLDNGGNGESPFESCGTHCQHLLDEGNAPGYGVCYWACVMRGGPNALVISSTVLGLANGVLEADANVP